VYPQAALDNGKITYMGVNQYTRKWQRLHTYGGKLCLAEGSPVLTSTGWVNIEDVKPGAQVWDGLEWVTTQGPIFNGEAEVIKVFDTWMTPDHEVLTTKGWRNASQSEGHIRHEVRLPDGREVPRIRWEEIDLGAEVRLWCQGISTSYRDGKATETGDSHVLRVQKENHDSSKENHTRNVKTPRVRSMESNVRSVPAAVASCMEKLRGARNYCMSKVEYLRGVLGGYGSDVRNWPFTRADQQCRGVLTGELQMGDQYRSRQQPEIQPICAGDDRSPVCEETRDKCNHSSIPTVARVYDLVSCGPRNRFVIATEFGPLIVHNCENVTQAAARDVIGHGMPLVEAAGYEIVITVHDEDITETPDLPEFNAKHLATLMTTIPSWGSGLPLAAAGFETYRYRKE
jgi:hypothetical protein